MPKARYRFPVVAPRHLYGEQRAWWLRTEARVDYLLSITEWRAMTAAERQEYKDLEIALAQYSYPV